MFAKQIFPATLALTLVCAGLVYAGKVELTTYFPPAKSDYKNVKTTGNAYLATTAGTAVGIGTTNQLGSLHVYDATNGPVINLETGTVATGCANIFLQTLGISGAAPNVCTASTKDWLIGARGNSYTTVAERNDLLVYYWSGTAWAIGMFFDSLTGNVGIGTSALTDIAGTASGDLTIAGSIAQDVWTAPALLNAWVNYGAPYNTAGYFRDKNGIVHLRGLLKNGTVGAIIFTLPAGYRPANQELIATSSWTTTIVMGRCDVDTSGNVYALVGGNAYFSLDGITFRASGY